MKQARHGETTSGCNCLTTKPHLILVFLLGAGLWRWRVGWGQVRTARRLDPRAAVVEYTLANHATIKKLFDVDGKYLPRCGIL